MLSLALLSIVPALNMRHWSIRAQEFPRIQYAVVGLLLLFVLVVAHIFRGAPSLWWTVLLLPSLYFQLVRIWPYTRLHRVEIASAQSNKDDSRRARVSVLSSNVLMENRSAQGLLDVVGQMRPDILITLETDAWWQEQLDAALSDWPYRVACPQDNLYGMHVYSRLALEDATIRYVVQGDVPSITATLEIGSDAQKIQLFAAHPRPPAPGENLRSTERDVELLLLADQIAALDVPVILAGDLNDAPWSRTAKLLRQISGLLDPRVGRGLASTFHADHAWLRWPLDHVLVSRHFKLVKFERMPHIGSDHFPVFAEFELDATNPGGELGQLDEVDRELELDTRDSDVATELDAQRPDLSSSQM